MSSSTDSLKKKVCVTVFLDELFEEVNDENAKQISEVTESEAIHKEKECNAVSLIDRSNHEKVQIIPNADSKRTQAQPRLRKHRKESKFSKNPYEPLKNEFSKYQYGGSDLKAECMNRELFESTLSDSDLDQSERFEFDKCLVRKSKSSLSEFSEFDLTEESFMSLNPGLSSMIVCRKKKRLKSESENKLDANVQSDEVSFCHRSTQFDAEKKDAEDVEEKVANDVCLLADANQLEDALAWKKTQKQIQLILAEAKSKYEEKEICERDRIKHYDLRSILEECEGTENFVNSFTMFENRRANASADFCYSDAREFSDSYACIFPHNKQKKSSRSLELKRVWARCKKNAWNDGFESDTSETDGNLYSKEIDLCSLRKDSLLCYALCVKCKKDALGEIDNKVLTTSDVCRRFVDCLETTCEKSTFEGMELKTIEDISCTPSATIIQRDADTAIVSEIFEKNFEEEKKIKKEGIELANLFESSREIEKRIKNYAEGDTFEKTLQKRSKLIFNLESKEKLLVCDSILKHVGGKTSISNEVIVNRAEIEFVSQNKTKKKLGTCRSAGETNQGIAEVFVKKKNDINADKSMMDAESEMVFAESETFCGSEDNLYTKNNIDSTASYTIQSKDSGKGICVVEFEDKLSRSKILRRMKTVEILGDNSMSEMKNISTEVILICENISKDDVCLEAWQSSASTLKSLTEMVECYLKDSNDSSMYLIEIPLHFTQPKRHPLSDSELFYKMSNSD